ncbi:STAS domain-containing protein [Dyella sp. OK004]|uniref:STAS domain-containing protein n=1 Tax=Dyella sp. OK004 TaxID=1855292 RepID=UPI0008E77F85|nr:STAS domain-containing protein [Dyella sp. OK004]SFR85920.1 STAS domain-containing protein [Dyella sp. OK004]
MGGKAKPPTASAATTRVMLPADCRIADLPAVKAELQAALSTASAELDASAVERVDTAALQLLAVFRREAASKGLAVAWVGASAALRDAAALLGLAHTLELPAATPA